MSPNCNLDLEDSTPMFLHDTLVHDGAPPYQVWLQKKLSGSEVTIQTKLLQTDKWLQYPHLSFITRGMYMVNQNTVKCSKQKYSSFWQHTLRQICKLIQVHQDIRTCPILNFWSKVTNKKKKCRRFFYHKKNTACTCSTLSQMHSTPVITKCKQTFPPHSIAVPLVNRTIPHSRDPAALFCL